jgi:hypothetical protein
MNRITHLLLAALMIATGANRLAAQSQSSTATASVQTLASITLTHQADLSFGSQFVGKAYGSVGTPNGAATWTGTVTSGSFLSASFQLPASLSDGAGHTVPFSCGTSSANLATQGSTGSTLFNPNTGLQKAPVASTGTFTLSVGNNGGGTSGDPTSANGCAVDLTNALGNTTYSGVITATVSIVM